MFSSYLKKKCFDQIGLNSNEGNKIDRVRFIRHNTTAAFRLHQRL